MAKEREPVGKLLHLAAWITGILVSLAVGFGMVDGVLSIRYLPTMFAVAAGWIVVVLSIVSLVLAIAKKM
ncbi:MAG: hypothetical protein AABW67_00285 [Nanoarchaeota archaeon]